MFLQALKWGLLALFVIVLTSCSNSINNRDTQSLYSHSRITTEQVRILEQNLSYKLNNDIHQSTAFLKYNDNQNYSIYVLPDYELIVEDSTQDLLYFAENKAISMRIEVLSNDVDWDLVKKATNSELTSLYKTIPIETSLADHFFEDSALHEVSNGDDIISTYFIKDPDMKLKLTMHTKTNEDHRDAFFQMAKTIMKENQLGNE
jgi:hypothetical protein